MLSKALKRPLVIFALIFCLGIFVSRRVKVHFLLAEILALIFLFLCLLCLRKRMRFDILLCCLVFSSGAALWKNSQILPRCHILNYTSYKNNYPYTVKGIVDSRPSFKNNSASFIFRAEEIKFNGLNYNTCGNILVYARPKKDSGSALTKLRDLQYGEELILTARLYRPFRFGANNRQGYRDYLYNQSIFSLMNVEAAGSIVRLKENKGFALRQTAFRLKERMEEIIFKRLSFVPASIMDAMVLGEKRNIPALIYNSMMKSGTVHILVVSGFNVALVAFILILSLKLARVPKGMRFYIAIPLLVTYCFMTGASTPVVRATVMAAVFMFACLIKREPDACNSLALAAVFILLINPRQLFDIGFQLSFASVISIIYLYPRLKPLVSPGILKISYIRFMVECCLVSLSAWLGTAAFIAYYFGILSPITALANIFIVPLASLVTLCGFSLIAMEFICPVLTPLFAYSSEFIISLLLNINAFLIKLPGAYLRLS